MPKKKAAPACVLKHLPPAMREDAARAAVEQSPTNAPNLDALPTSILAAPPDPQWLAALTSKYWGAKGVSLGVSFLDSPPTDLMVRIVAHMNAWGEAANVKFSWSASGGQVRIARDEGGYWSYLGTDVLLIPAGEPTMNLEGFTISTPESEYRRVVRHETGHTLGFPHEHLRRAIVAQLDTAKTIAWFRENYGWSEATTRDNVLTPLEEWSLVGSPAAADATSIMTYSLPASITRAGKAITGGADINASDRAYAAKIYPPVAPADLLITLPRDVPAGTYRLGKTAAAATDEEALKKRKRATAR